MSTEREAELKRSSNDPAEAGLDPNDWQSFRKSAHRALDDAIDYLEQARHRPVWLPVPESVKEALRSEMTDDPRSMDEVYQQFKTLILPYAVGNTHPSFFGWVHGAGMPNNLIADLMASAMNANCGGRSHGAHFVEQQVIAWFRDLFRMPQEGGGLLLSGTSMANLVALNTARAAKIPDMRKRGNQNLPLVVYASSEAHDCIRKAVELMGLGEQALQLIPACKDFAMDASLLEARIQADLDAGARPFCIVGSAGTVNTGAVDPLRQLASIAARFRLWFHVDGAFGALLALSDRLRERLDGIESADSIAFDFHKWAQVQYDAACVLVRNRDLLHGAFSTRPAYLEHATRGLASGSFWPAEFGPELSRSFRALKVWFAFQEHGRLRMARVVEQNCDQAQFLAEAIAADERFELLAPVAMNIVCFRLHPPGLSEERLSELNQWAVIELQERGLAAPSTTNLHHRLAIRVNLTNHRTRRQDLTDLLANLALLQDEWIEKLNNR